MTDAEWRLWGLLKEQNSRGRHWRRQQPIGPWVADFCLLSERLVVEVDGSQHDDPAVAARDAVRTRELERLGFRVVRFWNADVLRDLNACGDRIAEVLDEQRQGSDRPRR